jgi:hypothetical protein
VYFNATLALLTCTFELDDQPLMIPELTSSDIFEARPLRTLIVDGWARLAVIRI